jgi:hypothetical protein
MNIGFLCQRHIYYLFYERRSIFLKWAGTLKNGKRAEETRSRNSAIAADGNSCSAGIAGADSPSARPVCMRTSGG